MHDTIVLDYGNHVVDIIKYGELQLYAVAMFQLWWNIDRINNMLQYKLSQFGKMLYRIR